MAPFVGKEVAVHNWPAPIDKCVCVCVCVFVCVCVCVYMYTDRTSRD